MKIGLVGLPGSGKTTCFSLLSGHAAADHRHGAALAAVPLPDDRLEQLYTLTHARKLTPANVTFVDFEALHKGDAAHGELALHRVAGDVDALAVVVQCFGELDNLGEPLSPAADFETLMLEMALSDLAIIEKHLTRLATGPRAERKPQEIELMTRCRDHLSGGGALRALALSAEEHKHLRGFAPLTLKPLIVVFNVAESDIGAEANGECVRTVSACQLPYLVLCAEFEWELAQLPPADCGEFLAAAGLAQPARERVLRACFEMLDMIVFYTVNDHEARAWTVRRGATAPEAAGKVHSDMQAGFIRAEVTPFERFAQMGSLHDCKERGHTRVEGKDYVVRDGDILQIRFSH